MKTYQNKILYILFLFLLFNNLNSFSEAPYCANINFEQGDFTNWTGYTWIYQTKPVNSTPKVEGIVYGRQTIMSDVNAYDANTGNKLKIIPQGFKHCAKLGNINKGGQHQSLQYTLRVDSSNTLLIVKFAVVFLNPLDRHTKKEEPRFTITFFNSKGDTVPDCSNYDVYSGDASISGFQTYYPPGSSEPVVWRDWTTTGLDLRKYIGQDITVEFMAADCTHQGHYGYAYVAAECQPMDISVEYCTSDVYATLTAPDGFMSYRWVTQSSLLGTDRTYIVQNPNEGDSYRCKLISETGCEVDVKTVIQKYNPKADFTSNFDCATNTITFKNQSSVTNGSIEYNWDFGDGTTSSSANPIHTYSSFGPKTVKLTVKNPPSTCVDTMTQAVYTFERQKVRIEGNSGYCLGKTTMLKGVDAYRYVWSTGETTDSIKVGSAGQYWVVGYSQDGSCSSAPYYYNVTPYPDWTLDIEGNANLCEGDTISLKASGAVTYSWNTGETTNEIKIYKEGTYTVTGINENGCVKEKSFVVTQVKSPNVDFNLSKNSVNFKNNTVTASISAESNVNYEWDFGDGTQDNGNSVTHTYNIDYAVWKFPITLTAVNEFGCTSTATKNIDVLFFIPNVFTPNGDGKNDLFMPNVKLEIYDRNGILIYQGNEGWDGNFKGTKAEGDAYFYHLIYINGEGKEKQMKGYVILKR